MIQITLSFPSYAAAAVVLAKIDGGFVAQAVQTDDVPQVTHSEAPAPVEAPKRGRGRPSKTDKALLDQVEQTPAEAGAAMHAAARVEITPTAEVVAAAAPAPAPVDRYVTEVRPLITQAVGTPGVGGAKVAALLANFGATKGSELKPEHLDAFKQKLEALLAPQPEASLL